MDDKKSVPETHPFPGHGSALHRGFGILVGLVSLLGYGYFLEYMRTDYQLRSEDVLGRQMTDYVQMWVPIFVVTIFLETLWAFLTGRTGYWRVNDMIGSMGTGIIMVVLKATVAVVFAIAPYEYVWNNYRLSDYFQHGGLFAWWCMFIGVDFAYYWVHRTGHTMSCFWAMHSIHHQSEECNLTTALRQSSIHSVASNFYYVPLALLFPPHLFYIHSQFNLLYQYFLHTEVIGKLGPLEWVLNTPSQHRLHHGRQPYAIDTNYGGTLSVWDRIFGTFQEEIDEFPPAYGITHALNTFDPFYANIHPWLGILQNMRSVSGLRNKFLCLYNGPGWIPGSEPADEYEIPPCTRETVVKYDPALPGLFQVYLLLQFACSIAMQSLVVANLRSPDPALFQLAVVGMCLLFVTLYSLAALCDRRQFAFSLEVARLLALCAFALYLVEHLGSGIDWYGKQTVAVLVFTAHSLCWLIGYRAEICTPLQDFELGHDLPTAAEAHRRIEQRIAHKVVVNRRWIKDE